MTHRLGAYGLYQYDRFWPTFLVTGEDKYEPGQEDSLLHTKEMVLSATVPVRRMVRSSQSLSLAWRRRREATEETPMPRKVDLGGLEAAWALNSAQQHPYSISPVDGGYGWLPEGRPGVRQQLVLGKLYADAAPISA